MKRRFLQKFSIAGLLPVFQLINTFDDSIVTILIDNIFINDYIDISEMPRIQWSESHSDYFM